MIHFLSVPDAAEAAPEDGAEDTATEDAAVDAELPQPVKNAAPKAAAAAINVLLFIKIILSVKNPSICRLHNKPASKNPRLISQAAQASTKACISARLWGLVWKLNSGCHCTAITNRLSGRQTASTNPSLLTAMGCSVGASFRTA